LEFSIDVGKESSMKGKWFTEEQIIGMLKEHDAGRRRKSYAGDTGLAQGGRAADLLPEK
jgi:hypothetical protein